MSDVRTSVFLPFLMFHPRRSELPSVSWVIAQRCPHFIFSDNRQGIKQFMDVIGVLVSLRGEVLLIFGWKNSAFRGKIFMIIYD